MIRPSRALCRCHARFFFFFLFIYRPLLYLTLLVVSVVWHPDRTTAKRANLRFFITPLDVIAAGTKARFFFLTNFFQ